MLTYRYQDLLFCAFQHIYISIPFGFSLATSVFQQNTIMTWLLNVIKAEGKKEHSATFALLCVKNMS